jgi:hypothetical protein
MRVINAASVAEERQKNGETRMVKVYTGTADMNLKAENAKTHGDAVAYKVGGKWKNSAGYHELWGDIYREQQKLANAATPPTSTELAGYFAKLFIDVQRQADDLMDIRPFVANVILDENAQEVSYLRDYLPFIGKEKIMSGTNDKVPLIDAKQATTETITQYVRAFGWKASIKYYAFAPIPVLQRVTEAAARISTDYKNAQIMDPINAVGTWGAKHAVAADTTGSTFDLKMYNTLRKAKKALGKLIHPMYTNRLVSTMAGFNAPGLLVHPNNLWDVQRVIGGFTAGGFVQDISPLPIGDVIPYACGIQHGETWGEETLSLPGVTENYAYMFIPDQAVIVDKRDTTLEVGAGSVLELTNEERSWHRISGGNTSYLIGGAASGTNSGKGTIVQIALPTE